MSAKSDRDYMTGRLSQCEQRVMELRRTLANLDPDNDRKAYEHVKEAIRLLEIAHDSFNIALDCDRRNRPAKP